MVRSIRPITEILADWQTETAGNANLENTFKHCEIGQVNKNFHYGHATAQAKHFLGSIMFIIYFTHEAIICKTYDVLLGQYQMHIESPNRHISADLLGLDQIR